MMAVGSAQWLYMAEAEGCDNLVSTHQAKLNAVVTDIKQHPARTISSDLAIDILKRHGIFQISASDWEYILNHIK